MKDQQFIKALNTRGSWGAVMYTDKYLSGELASQREYIEISTKGTDQQKIINEETYKNLSKEERLNFERRNNKTNDGLTSSWNCSGKNFTKTLQMLTKLFKAERKIYSYVFVQSYHPADNVTPEKAHELGQELIEKYFKDFPVKLVTHTDTVVVDEEGKLLSGTTYHDGMQLFNIHKEKIKPDDLKLKDGDTIGGAYHNQFIVGNINVNDGTYCHIPPSLLYKMKLFGGRQCMREKFYNSLFDQEEARNVDYETGKKKVTSTREGAMEKHSNNKTHKAELVEILKNAVSKIQVASEDNIQEGWNQLRIELEKEGVTLRYSPTAKYYSVHHPEMKQACRGHNLAEGLAKTEIEATFLRNYQLNMEQSRNTEIEIEQAPAPAQPQTIEKKPEIIKEEPIKEQKTEIPEKEEIKQDSKEEERLPDPEITEQPEQEQKQEIEENKNPEPAQNNDLRTEQLRRIGEKYEQAMDERYEEFVKRWNEIEKTLAELKNAKKENYKDEIRSIAVDHQMKREILGRKREEHSRSLNLCIRAIQKFVFARNNIIQKIRDLRERIRTQTQDDKRG